MTVRTWTIVRFPAGVWSGGGKPSDPDYGDCEVYLIPADSLDKAKSKAQGVRSRMVKKGGDLPTQASPFKAG